MKRLNGILLFVAFLVVGNVGFSRTIASPYEVGTWQGFRAAAISYTFDDGTANQLPVAIPIFNEFDYDATLFTVTSWVSDWAGLRSAAFQGHEVASHTVTHVRLSSLTIADQTYELSVSQSTINTNVTNQKCITIAYPNCKAGDEALCAQYYIAGRNCSGAVELSTPANFYEIRSFICGSKGTVQTTADFIEKDDAAAASGGWCVFLLHGIDDDGGYSPLSSVILEESLVYLDNNWDTFWVSTFGNVVRYIKERNDVSVAETSVSDTSITLQVTDTLDNTIYNYPITIRRPLPAGWSSADVSQNGQAVNSSIVVANSMVYVVFDVVPDGGNVVLTKAEGTTPSLPTGLTAVAGDGMVTLNWNDNSESDLAGYNVYRSTVSGGPYSKIAPSVATSDYIDTSVTNGTTYYYVVTAVNTAGYESTYSSQVSATPSGGTVSSTMHVNSITVSIVYSNPVSNKARATVVVKDNLGAAVNGATVSGTFSGGITGSVSATTDASGTAILDSAAKKGLTIASFCVDSITHSSLTYDSAANVETCDSTP